MGTPEFAVPTLPTLLHSTYPVAAVVTQPDRPAGRGRKLEPSPVKRVAQAHGVPVLQPATLKDPQAVAELAAYAPDVIVVAAFGQILRAAVLEMPRFGCINVHASLLPRWRGAAPVQAAILAGDEATGCTIMRMDAGMDTGPILAQAALDIQADDTGGSLTARLAEQGAELLGQTLPRWLAGEIEPTPQDADQATTCRPLRKEQGVIDWRQPAVELARAVRAFNPWPAASTTWNGQGLKILRAAAASLPQLAEPGEVLAVDGAILAATGDGALRLEELQLAGRGPLSAVEFARGQRQFIGSRLG